MLTLEELDSVRGVEYIEHGQRIYTILRGMKERCSNPNHVGWANYGGRGITVCEEWATPITGWKPFYTWSLNNGYAPELTIDRIDNDGNYSPSNCRWATTKQQALNRSNNRLLTVLGETKTLTEWAQDSRCKVSLEALYKRLNSYAYEPELALTKINPRAKQIMLWGETKTIVDWVKDPRIDVTSSQASNRIFRGWSIKDSLTKPIRRA